MQLEERFRENKDILICFDALSPNALLKNIDDASNVPDEIHKLIEVYGAEEEVEVEQNFEDSGGDVKHQTVIIKPDIDATETEIQFVAWRNNIRRHSDEIFQTVSETTMYDLFKYMYTSRIYLVMKYVYRLYAIFLTPGSCYNSSLLTLSATTASSERSFSKLNIIKSDRRTRMGQNRLSGLAILSIERQLAKNADFDAVLRVCAKMSRRRIDI